MTCNLNNLKRIPYVSEIPNFCPNLMVRRLYKLFLTLHIDDNRGKYTSLIKICLFTMANTFIQDSFLAKLELIDILFTALVNDQDETIMQ